MDEHLQREIGLVIRDVGNHVEDIGEKIRYLGHLIAEGDVEDAAEQSYGDDDGN